MMNEKCSFIEFYRLEFDNIQKEIKS